MEERALGLARSELERTGVGGRRLLVPAEPVQELGAGRVPEVVPLQPGQPVDDLEPGLRPVGHRDGDCTVQLHDRRRAQLGEPAVEERDLRPVRGLLVVERRDRRLQLVRARAAKRQRPLERAPCPARSRPCPRGSGPARRAGRALPPVTRARRGARPAGGAARAGRVPRPRPASASRARPRAGSPLRTARGARAARSRR